MFHFSDITAQFENRLSADSTFELLEQRYLPYVFGSGSTAYRIWGKNVRMDYDGREGTVEISITPRHSKYPANNWALIYFGSTEDFISRGMDRVKARIKE